MFKWKRTLKQTTMIALFSALTFSTTITHASENKVYQTGKISYYSYECKNKFTASGERFNPDALTAAHRKLPFGTMIKVTNLNNGESVSVKITDRGPYSGNRILDLSVGAAKKIHMVSNGIVNASIEVMNKDS